MTRFHRTLNPVVAAILAVAFLVTPVFGDETGRKPARLHVVSAGIAEVPGQQPISCCAKDAKDIDRWAKGQQGKLFSKVHTTTLLNERATRSNILSAIGDLKARAKADDYSLVYLSSHGVCGPDGVFQFLAYDGGIRWTEMQRLLRDVPGTVLVVIDACQCGGVQGENVIVLSASLRNQSSGGSNNPNVNSTFTQYLMEALDGAADYDHDGNITLSEVETYVSNALAKLNKSKPNARQHQSMTVTRPANVPSSLLIAGLANSPAPVTVQPITTRPVAVQPVNVEPADWQPGPAEAADANPVAAQQPARNRPADLAGTTWTGSEALGAGYGKLTFRLLANGKAVMVDARNTVNGTWTRNGNRIELDFPGSCSYSGAIEGNTITGQGADATRRWEFSVTSKN